MEHLVPESVVECLSPWKIADRHDLRNVVDQLGSGGIVKRNSGGAWCRFVQHDAEFYS